MSVERLALNGHMLEKFMRQADITIEQLASDLNVSELTVTRWVEGSNQPAGTSAAVLGLLILASGVSHAPAVKEAAKKGLCLYRLIGSAIDPTSDMLKELECSVGMEILMKFQRSEISAIKKDLNKAIADVQVKHTKERHFFKKALNKVHEKLAQKVSKILGWGDGTCK